MQSTLNRTSLRTCNWHPEKACRKPITKWCHVPVHAVSVCHGVLLYAFIERRSSMLRSESFKASQNIILFWKKREMRLSVCVRVYESFQECTRERERERGGGGERERVCVCVWERERERECVCVCERERERERERDLWMPANINSGSTLCTCPQLSFCEGVITPQHRTYYGTSCQRYSSFFYFYATFASHFWKKQRCLLPFF